MPLSSLDRYCTYLICYGYTGITNAVGDVIGTMCRIVLLLYLSSSYLIIKLLMVYYLSDRGCIKPCSILLLI